MNRKGFPESYDTRRLLQFMRDLKSGVPEVDAPVYSHVNYDIVAEDAVHVRQPDIVILEGINVLQVSNEGNEFVSDYFDFSIYIDADEADIESWFLARFRTLRDTVFRNPDSFFRRYAEMSDIEAMDFAHDVWMNINGKNLRENIAPTRERASLIVRKGPDHLVQSVALRKI
jgi:type I pantothenate kinase